MSLRQVTKRDSHFLVKYVCDKKLQVRGTGFFATSEKISTGKTYLVQWGFSKRDTAEAEILASGTEEEMKLKLHTTEKEKPATGKKRKRETTTNGGKKKQATVIRLVEPISSTPAHPPLPSSSAPTSPPPMQALPPLPPVTPPPMQVLPLHPPLLPATPPPTEALPVNPHLQPATPPPTEAFPTINSPALRPSILPVTPTSSFPLHLSTAPPTPGIGPLRLGRPNDSNKMLTTLTSVEMTLRGMCREIEKLRQQGEVRGKQMQEMKQQGEVREKQMNEMKDEIQSMHRKIDEMRAQCTCGVVNKLTATQTAYEGAENIPLHVSACSSAAQLPDNIGLEPAILDALHRSSFNADHFACKLTQRLFPELFGVDNLRLQFNWHGGGNKDKKELDPLRKALIRTYVVRQYPEVRSETAWRDSVIAKVNECLRRRVKTEKRQNMHVADVQAPSNSFRSFINYMNQPEDSVYQNL